MYSRCRITCLIDTEPETKQRVFEHLDKFIIADDVILRDFTNDYATLNVEGPHAAQVLDKLVLLWRHARARLRNGRIPKSRM